MSRFAEGSTPVSNRVLASLLLCSFRYALGRTTYITGNCADWLSLYWHLMPAGYRRQVHEDIRKAIGSGDAGHDCDIAQWRRVLAMPLNQEVA